MSWYEREVFKRSGSAGKQRTEMVTLKTWPDPKDFPTDDSEIPNYVYNSERGIQV